MCNKERAVYNIKGESPEYCVNCKLPNMCSVVSKFCEICGEVQAKFGLKGGQVIRCHTCKTDDMINKKETLCEKCNQSRAHYNVEGKPPRRCYLCKDDGMVATGTTLCVTCKSRQAYYNFKGKPAKYCSDCSKDEMENVKRKICQTKGCDKTAEYGLPGTQPNSCSPHKTDGMLYRPRKRCSEPSCKHPATHGITTPDTCETHSKTDYILLTERQCNQCQRLDVLNAQGVCVNFCSLDELDRKYKKHLKQKEDAIRKLFQKELQLDQTVIQTWEDSVVDSSCTRRRPDFVFHCGTHVVIVEVDEHQHKSYSNCGSTREEKIRGENRRMFEIFQSFQSLHTDSVIPVLFIRYNPDAYTIQGRKGKTSDKQRRETLVRWVQQSLGINPLDSVPDPLSVLYLYYDEPVGPVGSTGVDGFVKVDVQMD
jgi:hypothetical protein